MKVYHSGSESHVGNGSELSAILKTHDPRGGGEFWLAQTAGDYPALAIRVSGDLADVTYFPSGEHPGFRFRGVDSDNTANAEMAFHYVGADPEFEVEVPCEFVVPFSTAVDIAHEFLTHSRLQMDLRWLEL